MKQQNRIVELEKGKAEQSRLIDALTGQTNDLRREADGLRAANAALKARLEALERRMAAARPTETNAAFARGE